MQRRQFAHTLTAGLALGVLSPALKGATTGRPAHRLKPKRLKNGDTVGLITPGSYIEDEDLEKAVKNIEDLGFRVKLSTHIRAERGFTAGTDAERLADLHAMFADEQVAGIWCARGGYGCSRLLPDIDYRLIRRHPKVFIGYSDITALHQAIYRETGLVTFHGPVASSEFTEYTKAHVEALLVNGAGPYEIDLFQGDTPQGDAAYEPVTIRAGTARGALAGGNLSLLAALAGTPYEIDPAGKVLFIEDVGEKPYRLDRMLTQLRQAGTLHQAAGIILGVFADCEPDPESHSLTLLETLTDRLYDLEIPVAYGFSFGHIDNQCTLPVGIDATMHTDKRNLTLNEPSVI